VIRALVAVTFYAVMIPIAALIAFPWAFLSGSVDFLYRVAMWIARTGVRLAGVRIDVIGLDTLNLDRNYIFMANHVSNADPPILIPSLPRRTSVLVKRELFKIPVLAQAMRMASLVPIDRHNKDAAIASVRRAADVLATGLDMTVFPEGTRSPDGRLLPFKKGPFYMAMDSGVPIVPVTIVGTHRILPKGTLRVFPGRAVLIFHPPIDPHDYPDRDALIGAVRDAIAASLPPELQ